MVAFITTICHVDDKIIYQRLLYQCWKIPKFLAEADSTVVIFTFVVQDKKPGHCNSIDDCCVPAGKPGSTYSINTSSSPAKSRTYRFC